MDDVAVRATVRVVVEIERASGKKSLVQMDPVDVPLSDNPGRISLSAVRAGAERAVLFARNWAMGVSPSRMMADIEAEMETIECGLVDTRDKLGPSFFQGRDSKTGNRLMQDVYRDGVLFARGVRIMASEQFLVAPDKYPNVLREVSRIRATLIERDVEARRLGRLAK